MSQVPELWKYFSRRCCVHYMDLGIGQFHVRRVVIITFTDQVAG